MSAEADSHPIEPGIAPLVFEFYALRLCLPCWSCEGHADEAGTLTRLPRVWFHYHDIVYLGLIAYCLFELRRARARGRPWQVRVGLSAADGGDALFSLEPALRPGGNKGASESLLGHNKPASPGKAAVKNGAGDEIRTHDPNLGKVVLYP